MMLYIKTNRRRGGFVENISIGTVRGQKNRYENAENVREDNIRIGKWIEAPDKTNKNK